MQDHSSHVPPDLAATVGHQEFERAFAAAAQSHRMHHAWLLTGPQGVGKALMARKAAAWLLREATDNSADAAEESARFVLNRADPGTALVLSGAHPDLMIVEARDADNKSGQIKIDQVRSLIPFMMHKPGRGGWRVAIIDSMDDLNRNGANALLKLLEEPPEQTVLLLVASRPGQLPPTIRSRCRVARLGRLAEDDSETVIRSIWPEADGEQLGILRILAEGAPGRALLLAESGAADCYQAVCKLLREDRLDRPALLTLCGKWGKGGAAGKPSRQGAAILMARLLRLSALRAAGGEGAALCDFEEKAVTALCARHSPDRLADLQLAFSRDAAKAEGLYLDFSQFLTRQITGLHQKSLP